MSGPMVFDPRLEELLREVARDPRSSLLRVPRPGVVRGFFDRSPRVSAAAAGLRSAERELLRRHRGELSKLLREACVMRLFEHPNARLYIARHHTAAGPVRVAEPAEWRERSGRALESARADGVEPSGAELLDECVREAGRLGRTTTAELAAAANRLEPTDEARICAAQELTADGALDTAQRLLEDVLAGHASARNRAYAAMSLGCVEAARERFASAVDNYRRATQSCGDLVVAQMNRLALSVFAQLREDAELAATQIDERVREGDPAVVEYLAMLAARRAHAATSSATKSSSPEWIDRLGPVGRSIARAVQ